MSVCRAYRPGTSLIHYHVFTVANVAQQHAFTCMRCHCSQKVTKMLLQSHTYAAHLRLRNDLYCVEWGVKLYSLTHSSPSDRQMLWVRSPTNHKVCDAWQAPDLQAPSHTYMPFGQGRGKCAFADLPVQWVKLKPVTSRLIDWDYGKCS